MFRRFNPNPANKSVGDCTVRAMCKLFNLDWLDAYDDLTNEGRLLMDSESECFYIKTTDASGMPLPLRTFSYKEVINTPKNSMQSAPANVPQIDISAFVTRTEFNELKQMIEEFRPSGKVD